MQRKWHVIQWPLCSVGGAEVGQEVRGTSEDLISQTEKFGHYLQGNGRQSFKGGKARTRFLFLLPLPPSLSPTFLPSFVSFFFFFFVFLLYCLTSNLRRNKISGEDVTRSWNSPQWQLISLFSLLVLCFLRAGTLCYICIAGIHHNHDREIAECAHSQVHVASWPS